MKHRKVHMIYMAAGNSRRFQGNKLLYTISGKALYRYGLETLIEVQKNYPDTRSCLRMTMSRNSPFLAPSRIRV